MANYANRIPRDLTGETMQDYPPAVIGKASWQKDNAVASSVISLNPNTTHIEVSSFGGQGAVIRWVPITETAAAAGAKASVVASGLGANFDHYIPTNFPLRYVVPRESMGTGGTGQIGSVNGLYQRLAWINAGSGAASILATEY